MHTQQLDRYTIGFGFAVTIVILFNTLLTIAKELYHPIHDIMTALSGNHWATQGILNILLFLILGFILSKKNLQSKNLLKTIITTTLLSLSGIILFFVFK